MQIKRTLLRLVLCIQGLSRAAYLPGRYTTILNSRKIATIFFKKSISFVKTFYYISILYLLIKSSS